MKGSLGTLSIEGHNCSLYLPPDYGTGAVAYPVVYVNGGDETEKVMEGVEPHFGKDCEPFLLLSIQPLNWNEEYSPWPAPAINKDGQAFGGGTSGYLRFLTKTVKPYIDGNYRTIPVPEATALIGYSLGGLASLYALYTCSAFGKIGSLSGSLWFEGWTEFMEQNAPVNAGAKVYLSLGKGEEHSRNQVMAKVGDCTRKAAGILERQLASKENAMLEWNNGGHFTDIPQRYQRALLWLMAH